MPKLPERLSRELLTEGNLPLSREGVAHLRPDMMREVELTEEIIRAEVYADNMPREEQPNGALERAILVARFVPLSIGVEQFHLFVMQGAESGDTETGLKRWSKRPVSYGSFVQITKILAERWGEIRDLHVQKSQMQLSP